MDMHSVQKLFDSEADNWDGRMFRDENAISNILNNATLGKYMSVLDVACGTGILVPDYIDRGLDPIYCLDISSEMIKVAQAKFSGSQVKFIHEDPMSYEPGRKFDRIMILDAFCHFPEQEKLVAHLSRLLKKNGLLVVATDMSRDAVNEYHRTHNSPAHVLPPVEELAEMFEKYLKVTVTVDNEQMYQICGKKR